MKFGRCLEHRSKLPMLRKGHRSAKSPSQEPLPTSASLSTSLTQGETWWWDGCHPHSRRVLLIAGQNRRPPPTEEVALGQGTETDLVWWREGIIWDLAVKPALSRYLLGASPTHFQASTNAFLHRKKSTKQSNKQQTWEWPDRFLSISWQGSMAGPVMMQAGLRVGLPAMEPLGQLGGPSGQAAHEQGGIWLASCCLSRPSICLSICPRCCWQEEGVRTGECWQGVRRLSPSLAPTPPLP